MPDVDINGDEALVAKLRRLFRIEEADLAFSQQFAERMLPFIEQAADEAFDFILSSPELADLLRNEEARQKMRVGQKTAFIALVTGQIDETCVRRNRQIGAAHEAAGIEPFGYLACYAYFTHRLLEQTMAMAQGFSHEELLKIFQILSKLIFLSIALAWEAYYRVREQRVMESYRALEMSHNLSLRMVDEQDKEIKGLLERLQHPPPRVADREVTYHLKSDTVGTTSFGCGLAWRAARPQTGVPG